MQHSRNHAVMTYRGHEVLQTLIRAYWSPAHSTAQRYLYTGDPNGHITIYGGLPGLTCTWPLSQMVQSLTCPQ